MAVVDRMRYTVRCPRPINLEAKAGTISMFDGRVLHGGAVNHSDKFRYVMTNSCVMSFIRQQ